MVEKNEMIFGTRAVIEAIEAGGYDYAFFQCHSYKRIFNGTDDDMGVLQPMKDIVALTRKHNPEVQPLIALAWARKYGNNHTGAGGVGLGFDVAPYVHPLVRGARLQGKDARLPGGR